MIENNVDNNCVFNLIIAVVLSIINYTGRCFMDNKKPKIYGSLKIVAPIVLVIGILLIVLAVTVFRQPFGEFTQPNFAILIIGAMFATFSIPCFVVAFFPEIQKMQLKTMQYVQKENEDVLKNLANTQADINKQAVKTTAIAIKSELKNSKYCSECGEKIEEDSKFCNHCGKKQ